MKITIIADGTKTEIFDVVTVYTYKDFLYVAYHFGGEIVEQCFDKEEIVNFMITN